MEYGRLLEMFDRDLEPEDGDRLVKELRRWVKRRCGGSKRAMRDYVMKMYVVHLENTSQELCCMACSLCIG
jgi:hypothetical protein